MQHGSGKNCPVCRRALCRHFGVLPAIARRGVLPLGLRQNPDAFAFSLLMDAWYGAKGGKIPFAFSGRCAFSKV